MKISVIIPLFNKAAYIERALASVAAQTFTDYEVIVIDDGSTDGGAAVAANSRDPRVRVLSQPNTGPGAARNRGLAEASGEFIAFLDADDEWLPDFLLRALAVLESGASLVGNGYYEYPNGNSTEQFWRRRGLNDGMYRLSAKTSPRFAVHLLAYLSPWSILARTEVIRRWGGFYERGRCLYGEDSFLFLKILLNETIAVNMQPLARYHREASELSIGKRSPRPVEPMLIEADEIKAACPPDLRGLLAGILAIRAEKTACMLGYWGRRREARTLLGRFQSRPAWTRKTYWLARTAASPLAPIGGWCMRNLARQ